MVRLKADGQAGGQSESTALNDGEVAARACRSRQNIRESENDEQLFPLAKGIRSHVEFDIQCGARQEAQNSVISLYRVETQYPHTPGDATKYHDQNQQPKCDGGTAMY